MSYNSLWAQYQDEPLRGRVTAAAQQEARTSESGSDFGHAVANGQIDPLSVLMWPVCTNTEAAYESALAGDNPNPGGDESVITDGAILSSVQAAWPPDPWPAP
jgi:hypothetical protein